MLVRTEDLVCFRAHHCHLMKAPRLSEAGFLEEKAPGANKEIPRSGPSFQL